MDIDGVKELLNLIEKSNFSKVELCIGGDSLKLEKVDSKEISLDRIYYEDNEVCDSLIEERINGQAFIEIIKSPMVGVFHNSASPEEDPFVSIGSKVKKGDVIGIVEAMKLMNEIESNCEGEVIEICKKDNETVGYGDVLIKIKLG
ncbi:biotin/lipoyl-containing protein [Clostridium sp. C8-1-8]|uniref:acetyl-CoA carboxylase biotin carboxyl carrier protein n=1 Tax=Clostridium sp. C8-1-8 TaxID=2698831 RepID=UPI001371E119|nr:biotin/lipoyl-containing protein [Clostridium sp. C8-1-8]